MSKNFYIGNGNIAREGQDIYVGVNGVARKVKSGYVGVNGVARKFWPKIVYVWNRYNIITNYRWNKNYTVGVEENDVVYRNEPDPSTTWQRINFYVGTSDVYISLDNWDSGQNNGFYSFSPKYVWKNGESARYRNRYIYYIGLTPPTGEPIDYAYRIRRTETDEFQLNRQNGYIYTDANYFIKLKVTPTPGRFLEYVYDTNINAYPNNGVLVNNEDYISYYYNNRTVMSQDQGSFVGTITSELPDEYPQNGIQGKYWYVYQGVQ